MTQTTGDVTVTETPELGTTEHYGLPLWGENNRANVRTTINASALAVDGALQQGVADAAAAAHEAAAPFADTATERAAAASAAAAYAAGAAVGESITASFLFLGA